MSVPSGKHCGGEKKSVVRQKAVQRTNANVLVAYIAGQNEPLLKRKAFEKCNKEKVILTSVLLSLWRLFLCCACFPGTDGDDVSRGKGRNANKLISRLPSIIVDVPPKLFCVFFLRVVGTWPHEKYFRECGDFNTRVPLLN